MKKRTADKKESILGTNEKRINEAKTKIEPEIRNPMVFCYPNSALPRLFLVKLKFNSYTQALLKIF